MMKIKVPGERKTMDVGYDAVVVYKKYYEEKGSQYRVTAYTKLLEALDKERENGVVFDEESFETFINNYMDVLIQNRRTIRKQLREEKDPNKKAELKQLRKQNIKSFAYVGWFSNKYRRLRAAAVANVAIH